MGILDDLVAAAKARVEAAKKEMSLEDMCHDATVKALNQKATYQLHRGGMSRVRGASSPRGPLFWFGQVLSDDEVSIVGEIKQVIPETGATAYRLSLARVVAELEQAGATALCYVTEPTRYAGTLEAFDEVSGLTNLPLLRRDVLVDEYQLYEAKLMDAAAVSLSCAVLDGDTIKHFIETCDLLGIDAFVEVHDESEVRSALDAGARIIAVDARDPQTGEVDLGVVERLAPVVPLDCVFVAVSGVRSSEDVEKVTAVGVDAIMIGEALLGAQFIGATLGEFRHVAKRQREEYPETERGTKFDDGLGAPPSMPGAPGAVPRIGAPAAPGPSCPPASAPSGAPF